MTMWSWDELTFYIYKEANIDKKHGFHQLEDYLLIEVLW